MRTFQKFLELLFPPRKNESIVRYAGSDALRSRFFPKRFTHTTTGLLPYRDEVVRAFILEAKFHGNEAAQNALGEVLTEYIRSLNLGENLVLVPVPLGEKRRKERGYNQAEEICRAAASLLGSVPLRSDTLRRVRDTLPQTELSGNARRENMQGAFLAASDLDPSSSYIVVDDVMTTGATLHAAAEAFRLVGIQKITAVALAH